MEALKNISNLNIFIREDEGERTLRHMHKRRQTNFHEDLLQLLSTLILIVDCVIICIDHSQRNNQKL
jgi:hypothetical protein